MLRQSGCERQRLVGTNTKGPSVAQGNLDAFESGNVIEPTTRREMDAPSPPPLVPDRRRTDYFVPFDAFAPKARTEKPDQFCRRNFDGE